MSLKDFKKGDVVVQILNAEKGGWGFARRDHHPVDPIVDATYDEVSQVLTIVLAEDKGVIQFNGVETLYRPGFGNQPNTMVAYSTRQGEITARKADGGGTRTAQIPQAPIGYFCHIARTEHALALTRTRQAEKEAANKEREAQRAERERQAQERAMERGRQFTAKLREALGDSVKEFSFCFGDARANQTGLQISIVLPDGRALEIYADAFDFNYIGASIKVDDQTFDLGEQSID